MATGDREVKGFSQGLQAGKQAAWPLAGRLSSSKTAQGSCLVKCVFFSPQSHGIQRMLRLPSIVYGATRGVSCVSHIHGLCLDSLAV